MSKKALGRGIDALFKEMETPGILAVPVSSLKASRYQPRSRFPEDSLSELAESIKQKGIIQPLIVERDSGGQSFTIIAGERRFRAARLAGLDTVPVIVKDANPEEKIEIALIENVQREDLNPVEEAQGYRILMEEAKLSQEEIAKKVGKSRSTIANSMRLLKLPHPILQAIGEGTISAGHARALLSVADSSHRKAFFRRIVDEGLTVRQAERMSARLNQRSTETPKGVSQAGKKRDPELESLEQRLIEHFGTKVELKGDQQKGRIAVSYYSSEDLERLLELLGMPV
jgi:ParB family chromosome partitioning protein